MSTLTQPPECFAAGCPLAGVGTGFVLGSGDPERAKMALMLEAPGREELTYEVDANELERRKRAFPNLDIRFLRRGAPVVGRAGATLFGWGLAPLQIKRDALFIDNGLRCLPPREKQGPYPKGAIRKKAEACCRMWDRWEGEGAFRPTISLINIHPAAVAREATPLILQTRTFEKAKDFAAQSEKPLVLCGGKAAKVWLGYGENVSRWMGHYEVENESTRALREARREEGMKMSVEKGKKPKKLTAKQVLERILSLGQLDPESMQYEFEFKMSDASYREAMELLIPKPKKVKVKSERVEEETGK